MDEEKKENSWFSQDLLSRLLNYSAFVIIFTVVICFIILTSLKSCSSSEYKATEKIKEIKFVNVPKIEKGQQIVITGQLLKELKSSVDSLNYNIRKFEDIKSEIVKIEERNKDDMKFYLTILGSIIAVVGFFGFKSINDTRESSIKIATDEAKLTAKGIATAEAKDAIKIEHQDWSTKISTIEKNYDDLKTLLAPIGDLETKVTILKIRIDTLENNSPDKEINESVMLEGDKTVDDQSKVEEISIKDDIDSDENSDDLDSEDKFADKIV
ncbi:hypothetical protein [Flavobacterium johnsoniae]|uniref:Uncharacterized protein n=1 Tax=Flavobacterium johnsoniae TaxID=986 RepID=A0A1M5QT52_FLAJO|nr:hypothetical protein [Flavobacterium johnsoniae]SHH17307.1 hypothetical protein SAMN05444388_107159 [Flavobacterium johnsoniae]